MEMSLKKNISIVLGFSRIGKKPPKWLKPVLAGFLTAKFAFATNFIRTLIKRVSWARLCYTIELYDVLYPLYLQELLLLKNEKCFLCAGII